MVPVLSEGARRLKALKVSDAALATMLGSMGFKVAPQAVGRWRSGKRAPVQEARDVMARPPLSIPLEAWDGEGERGVLPPDDDVPPRAPRAPPHDVPPDPAKPSARQLQEELLERIQDYRTEAIAKGRTIQAAALISHEQKAIAELAKLTGESGAPESVLVKSPAWVKLRAELLVALEGAGEVVVRSVRAAFERNGAA
jgi:hypothetical protein